MPQVNGPSWPTARVRIRNRNFFIGLFAAGQGVELCTCCVEICREWQVQGDAN
jgi:hypothetical protein